VARAPVVVVGSGLAGLSCAFELRRCGLEVTVVSPARPGCDGASHRVHALAPWILVTAPWVKGDSPEGFRRDLVRRGGGLERPEVCEVFAQHAAAAARELIDLLDLVPIDGRPTLLPGDEHPRGLRCLPRGGGPVLARLTAACADAGVRFAAPALVVGLVRSGERVTGAVVRDRRDGTCRLLPAGAVVLACGGSAGVFPVTTAPRWCRGSGLALAVAAGALLHRPQLTQALPVTATRPPLFPSTAALTGGSVVVGGRLMAAGQTLDEVTWEVARAGNAGLAAALQATDSAGSAVLPARVKAMLESAREGLLPLAVAVHHGIGGVAIDAWGRTSLPGLYACGEAAGGVQGRRRTMGTGLLEARVFGVRAARAVTHDLSRPRLGADGGGSLACPPPAAAPERLEEALDRLLGPLAVERPPNGVARALVALEEWPRDDTGMASPAAELAGLRRSAAVALLLAERTGQNEIGGGQG